jgi:predicted enzyme related to lactoylglutathione lyase
MPRVVHFEISADDTERAKDFYSSVFGWHFQPFAGSDNDYHIVMTGEGPGINGGMFKRRGPVGHVNTIDVPSVDEFAAKVRESGGEVVMEKTPIPGVGWLVYCKDTEGSLFGIMQNDPAAQ